MSITIGGKIPQSISIDGKAVASLSINGEVVWPDTPSGPDYFYIENAYNGQNTVNVYAPSAARTTDAQYSKDGTNWTNMVFDSFPKKINITLNQGEKVYFRSSTGWSGDTNGVRIQPQQSAIAGGDLRTILNYTDVNSITSIGDYDINCLFKAGGTALRPVSGLTDISAVKLGTITSSTTYRSFEDFCWNCPNLEKGLDLSTFTSPYDHSSAQTFKNMYYHCVSLNEAWAPNVSSISNGILDYWMDGVTSTGVVHIPSGLCVGSGTGCIHENSVNGIPSNWTYDTY